VNRVVKLFYDALQHIGWKKGWFPTIFTNSADNIEGMKIRVFSPNKLKHILCE